MARSPEQFTNAPLPTYDVAADDLLDTEAAGKLADQAHPETSEANIFKVDLVKLDKQDASAPDASAEVTAQTAQLIKEAKALRAVVARVPLYRDAFGYDSGKQLRDEQRIPLRAAFQIMLRGGSLAQKLKEAQRLMVRGGYDSALNNEIAREIEHIKKYEAIVTEALATQNITLPESSGSTSATSSGRRTLKVTSAEADSPVDEIVAAPGRAQSAEIGLDTGDKPPVVESVPRTMEETSMSAENPIKTPESAVQRPLSPAEFIAERNQAWSQRVHEYKTRLEALKETGTAQYVESLPEYQSFQNNLQAVEPLLDGSWPEDDAIKTHLLQDKMHRLAENFFSIDAVVKERRAAFEASFGAELSDMRDDMGELPPAAETTPVQKKTGWFNPVYREAQTTTAAEVVAAPSTPNEAAPFVLTPDMRVDDSSTETETASDIGTGDGPESVPVNTVQAGEDSIGTYVEPDMELLQRQEDWRVVAEEERAMVSPEFHKLQKLSETAEALEEQLTGVIVAAAENYDIFSQPPNEHINQLVRIRSRLRNSVMGRVRALAALPASELATDEVHALETQLGEVEYEVKHLLPLAATASETTTSEAPLAGAESELGETVTGAVLDHAPGTTVLPKNEGETPAGFSAGAVETGMSLRGGAPEEVISAFDKERHQTMRKMQALREKSDTSEARKWFTRFGAAALLALLATPTDNNKQSDASGVVPGGVTTIDGAWPTLEAPTAAGQENFTMPSYTTDERPSSETPELVEPQVVDTAPTVETVTPLLYTFDGARGLNGKVIDTVSEAAFDEWQRNRSLLSKPITATQFLASMWNLLSELEKNPDLEKKLTADMQIESGDIDMVFEGKTNAIDLQPFYKLLDSRI